jgi:DNA-binding MarR family transcriptional regulator
MGLPGNHLRRTSRPRTPRPNLTPLLRSTHIFASTVHDVLQLDPLHRIAKHPITPAQCNLLRIASMKGRHPVGQVASLLGISAPAATKTIDRLESLGLVERVPCEGDRRTHLFKVTASGRALVRRCENMKMARLRAVAEQFELEEIAQLEDLLTRFSVSLLSGPHDETRPCLLCAAHIHEKCPVARVRGGCPYAELIRGRRARESARGDPSRAGVPC